MISGLLQQLQNQYSLGNAPNPAPAVGDPNNLSGLLQTSGIPMTQNPMQQRTPNYMSLLGMMGQQPFTPGYTGMDGASSGDGTNDYLSRMLDGGQQSPAMPQRAFNPSASNLYGNQFANWLNTGPFGIPQAGTFARNVSPYSGGMEGAYQRYLDETRYNGGGG